jgi:hypothetical protein
VKIDPKQYVFGIGPLLNGAAFYKKSEWPITAKHAAEMKAHVGDDEWEAGGLKNPEPKDLPYEELEAIRSLAGLEDGVEGPISCGKTSKKKLEALGFVHDPTVDAYLEYLTSIDAF